MEPLLIALGAVIAVLLIAVALLARRADDTNRGSSDDALARELERQGSLMQRTIAELRESHDRSLAELRGEMQRSLGATEQQLLTQTGSTHKTLGELSRQLGALKEQGAQVAELAKDIGSLHDLLRAPKPRGGFGELLLERLLADNLPGASFQLQYSFRDGTRVDAMVHFAGRLVPIDAKFPIESWSALADATDDADRRARRRAFLQQVKRHVDAVARYVKPGEGTIDFALMYVPSEAVYYESIVREESDLDLRAHCAERHVIPVSPNTLLSYLQVIALGLRGMAIQERARELQAGIRHAALELEKFRGLHEQLGRHLDNASKKHLESLRTLDRATDAVGAIASSGGTPEQPQLPLPADPLEQDPGAGAPVSEGKARAWALAEPPER